MAEHYYPDRSFGASTSAAAINVMAKRYAGCEIMLAFSGSTPEVFVTFAMMFPSSGLGLHLQLKDVFAAKAARSSGVGERLMRALAKVAVARDVVRMKWGTETDNPGAMQFYERLGATRMENRVIYRLSDAQIARVAEG